MSTQTLSLALELAIQLLVESQRISALIMAAQAEGRDITDAEWNGITADADASRQALVEAIERARAAGR